LGKGFENKSFPSKIKVLSFHLNSTLKPRNNNQKGKIKSNRQLKNQNRETKKFHKKSKSDLAYFIACAMRQ